MSKKVKIFFTNRLGFLIFLTFLLVLGSSVSSFSATGDVLLGVVDSQTEIDPGNINEGNFGEIFTYNGTTEPSLTMGTNIQAQIGAIWTGGTVGNWRQIRIIIDTNGDNAFTPFDWSDPSHPWNRPDDVSMSWSYTYPDDYPDASLRGQTITMTWDEQNYCVNGFPWDNFEWGWYEADSDRTDGWWMESGQLMNIWWEGRDNQWNMLPNGNYKVKAWVDENDNGEFEEIEASKVMVIKVETASVSGIVEDAAHNPIEGARVEAGSHLAWGETRSNADGTFIISGLEAGASYHISVRAEEKVSSEKDVELPEGQSTADAGTFTMVNAVAITGTILLDQDGDGNSGDAFAPFTNQWNETQNELFVWIDTFNTQGSGWGNANVVFNENDSSVNFSIYILPPASTVTYQLNANADGFAASPVNVTVDASGGNAGTIVLTKASMLTGSVRLPQAVSEWKSIDVQAISTSNNDERYWGWGEIAPGDSTTDTGSFTISGIPVGSYTLEVRVMGYMTKTVEGIEIEQGINKDVGLLDVSLGKTISGTLTIQGDTTDFVRWEGDNQAELDIWVDAWSGSGGWGGTNVRVLRGTDQSVSYMIGGLSDGTYEINCWLGEGYELVDGQGNAPVFATVAENVTKNLALKPFEGMITGEITGPEALDINKVVIEVKRPWDWLPPKIATVSNGKINPQTGVYTISGLGTGDYVIKAGMYTGVFSMGDASGGDTGGSTQGLTDSTDLGTYTGDGYLIPDTAIGIVSLRTFVQNDAGNPTTMNITFSQGYSVYGTVSLSTTDPPWHDFGDGEGGAPNGRKDVDLQDPTQSEVISMAADVIGLPVVAMPMEMMFMGGEDPRMGMIMPDGTFKIDGLAPGVYILSPPFGSNRISMIEGPDGMQSFDEGMQTHHWTVNTQMVVITDSDIRDRNFILGNGYTITGTITMPEAQASTQENEWQWIGQLNLETPANEYMGHEKSICKGDFNNTNKYSFKFNHVANGDYIVRFWTDMYVPGLQKVTVNNSNATVNVTVEEGANLVGKLIDEGTGEAITAEDGIRVVCEAFPHVEGSWRETRTEDPYSLSYIEDDSGLRSSGATSDGSSTRENLTPGKFHLNAVKTGYKYVIYVEAFNGKKTQGAKNYVGKVIADIEIPDGATGDIDVGTIKLIEGTTIKGRIIDAGSNPVPGIEVFAMPSNTHDGTGEAMGVSDTQGYYTVYGVSPDVEYYDLIAAERPFMFEDWGKQVEWGEKRKYNIAPGSTGIDFTLYPTTATLSGTVTVPSGVDFMLPFKGEGEVFPAAYILLQKKGVVYKDTLEGIEGVTAPTPSGTLSAAYTVDNIVPGTYNVTFMNYGLPSKIIKNVVVEEGNNTLDMEWATAGYAISGSCTLSSGGYPSSSDISGVVCMNTANQSITFGVLTAEADGTFSAYEVPGLEEGQQYQLAFYQDTGMDDMPDVFPVGAPFTPAADVTRDAVISRNTAPILMVQSTQDPNDSTKFNIGIWSTTYLTDRNISVVGVEPTADSTSGEIYISTGSGSLSNAALSGDKRNITATYTADASDGDVSLILAVHYGSDATTFLKTLTFNVNTQAANSDVVNIYTAGQVKLGSGDASQIYVPAGSVETSDNGKAVVNIVKTDEQPGAASMGLLSKEDAGKMGVFAISVTEALPTDVTAAGKLYDFSVQAANSEATVTINSGITVQLEYDPNLVTDVNLLDVWHLVNNTWQRENVNKIIDTENHTISAEVTSLSPFIIAEAPPEVSDDLNSGWRLISLETQPSDTSISAVLSNIAGKYESVWSYVNGGWKSYNPINPGFSNLSTMEAGKGYWIKMTETGNISVSGSAAVGSVSLSSGWNLVGFNASESISITDAIASIEGKVISVWEYSDSGWKVYVPSNQGFNTLGAMTPGKGYWINTTGNCTWTLP